MNEWTKLEDLTKDGEAPGTTMGSSSDTQVWKEKGIDQQMQHLVRATVMGEGSQVGDCIMTEIAKTLTSPLTLLSPTSASR